ncbi:MAG TPA: DegT/DnrJ/EryC1/StrS family aminotransferase, partial [Gemmatimonadales bacterium]|nr:DegT/DnrJ/EryC1/StrS family aminotransferase [Gemmatimonadales bacterium]
VYYPLALHLQPCFAYLGTGKGALPVTERATDEVVSLPIYPELTSAHIEAVIAAIREFYQG